MTGGPGFPVSHCGRCGREVLTHLHLDEGGAERRLCFHCDAELDPEALRWVSEAALAGLGYGIAGDAAEGGCGRPGCGKGNCSNRL